jgi:hypothetical protein
MKIRTMFLYIIIAALILSLTSCSRYTGYRTSNGCGVWYPKTFEGENRGKKTKVLVAVSTFVMGSLLLTLKYNK